MIRPALSAGRLPAPRTTPTLLERVDRPAAIREAIRRTEPGPKALFPVGTLSRGHRQRVGVAQAILHRPRIVILDEPTNGLDASQTRHMRDLVRELAQHGTVISTHILQEVEAVCDRVPILRSGRLAPDARLEELGHAGYLSVSLDAGRCSRRWMGKTGAECRQLGDQAVRARCSVPACGAMSSRAPGS